MDDQKNLIPEQKLPSNSNKFTPESVKSSRSDTMTVQDFMESVKAIESRLTDTLSTKIIHAIKPLSQSKMEILEEELKGYIYLFTEVQKTIIGSLLLRRLYSKLDKIDKAEEEKQQVSVIEVQANKRKIRQIVKDIIKKI